MLDTEFVNAERQGMKDAYIEHDVRKYRYVATLDGLTCSICEELDGKVFELLKAEVGVNYPPIHRHCRCTVIPFFKDFDDNKRIARDENGNPVEVSMTYKEWKNEYGKAKKDRKTIEESTKSDTIKSNKMVEGHSGTPKKAVANDVIDHITEDGKVDVRSFYGKNNLKVKDIHTTNHGNPVRHPFGTNGEHAHDYEWDSEEKLKHKTARELSDKEREENGNIL